MRVSLCQMSGREVLEVEGKPSWQLSDVLGALKEQDVDMADVRTRIFVGGVELRDTRCFDEAGVVPGAVLTIVRTPALRVVGVWAKRAMIMSPTSGECLQTLCGHDGLVCDSEFSNDGRQVVTASFDHTARIWCAASGKCVRILVGHRARVSSAAFSRDDKQVITAGCDRTARIWSVASGQCLQTLHDPSMILSASFSPQDPDEVLIACKYGSIKIMSISLGQSVRELPCQFTKPRAAYSPSGREILVSSGDKAHVFSATSGFLLHSMMGAMYKPSFAAFSPNGDEVITCCEDGSILIFSMADGSLLERVVCHRGTVLSAEFSPEGQEVITSGQHDGTLKVWSRANWELKLTVPHCVAATFSRQ